MASTVSLTLSQQLGEVVWGTGADKFVFDTSLGTLKERNVDTIGDFNVADDTIWLDNSEFTALAAVDIRTLSSKFCTQ